MIEPIAHVSYSLISVKPGERSSSAPTLSEPIHLKNCKKKAA
jgi:hypothetical protein